MTEIQHKIEMAIVASGGNTFEFHQKRRPNTDSGDFNEDFADYILMQIDMVDEN